MVEKKNKVGRPKGQKKTSRLEVMMSPDVKNKFINITKNNGSNPSVKINEMVIKYIKESEEENG